MTDKKENRIIGALERFFIHPAVDRTVIVMVVSASLVAVASLFYDTPYLNCINYFFSALFAVELSVRFITYNAPEDGRGTKDYFREWWIDWIATIPWDLVLQILFSGPATQMTRLLRLPRIVRILRFRHLHKSRLYQIFNYRLKRLIEGSLVKQLTILGLFSIAITVLFAVLFDGLSADFGHSDNLWFSVISLFSADSLFEIAEQPVAMKLLTLLLCSIGIVAFNGILIALIVGHIMEQLERLKNGYGAVHESNHLILLGNCKYVGHIIRELDIYCCTERKLMKVVVLRDAVRDDDNKQILSTPRVDVISRVGSGWNQSDLSRISFSNCQGVVVFGGDDQVVADGASPMINDALVTKALVSILSLMSPGGRRRSNAPNVVLNYRDPAQMEYARGYLNRRIDKVPALHFSSGNPVFFDPVYYMSKMIGCLCVHPHAYGIFDELLSYEGSELHIVEGLASPVSVADMFDRFTHGIFIGFRDPAAEGDAGNDQWRLAPSPDEIVPGGTELVVLAENATDAEKTTRSLSSNARQKRKMPIQLNVPTVKNHGSIAIIGVNDKLPRIMEELERQRWHSIYVIDDQSEAMFFEWYGVQMSLRETPLDVRPRYIECHFRNKQEVENRIPVEGVDTFIILADGLRLGGRDDDKIDADTFSRLLMIQHLLSKNTSQNTKRLIVEILTRDTESAVSQFEECSYVVGPLFIARLLTNVALTPGLEDIFSRLIQTGEVDIVSSALSRVCSFPTSDAIESLTFGDILCSRQDSSIPIGWVTKGDSATDHRHMKTKTVLNPDRRCPLPPDAEIIYIARNVEYAGSTRDTGQL